MVYLILILVLAMIVGPVVWMRPSPAQERQAKLRLKARALGLDVRVTELPQTHRAAVRREDTLQGVAYRLPVFDPKTVAALSHRSVRDSGTATWEESGDALPPALRECLDQVRAHVSGDVAGIELGAHGPVIYWRERGDESRVEQIAAQLTALRDAMLR